MKLDDVELQQTTGFLISKGCLKVGSVNDAAHSRVLLGSLSNTTTIWPVTQLKRNEYGFYEATTDEVGLAFRSLSLDEIAGLSRPGEGRCSLTRGGAQAGELLVREKLGDGGIEKRASPIQNYKLATEYGPEGLHIEISGQVAAEGEAGKPFLVDATVPWATLSVKGLQFAGAEWKFGHPQGLPSRLDSANRPRDPRKLSDLLLSQGLTWPYLKGWLSLAPEPSWPSPEESAHSFVSMHFDYNRIGFGDAPKLKVLDTGFAYSFSGLNRILDLVMFDRERLERAFQQRDAISIQLKGDGIGLVRYTTPYREEPGDPLGWISQAIKTMSLKMALGKDGLEISADGELDDFDPSDFARHREMRNSQLKPLHTYSVRATMPWALLVARGFSFAYRARNF